MKRPLIVLATIVLAMTLYVANFGFWMRDEVVSTDAFSASARVAMSAEGSHEALAQIITEQAVETYPILVLFESPLESLFGSLLATGEFDDALTIGIADVHRRVFEGDSSGVVVDLSTYRSTILGTVGAISPGLAERIPDRLFAGFEILSPGTLPDASLEAQRVVMAGWIALIASITVAALLVLYVKSFVSFAAAIGSAFVMTSLATAVIIPGAREAMRSTVSDDSYLVLALNFYDELVRSLAYRSLILGAIGGVMLVLSGVVWLAQRNGRRAAT